MLSTVLLFASCSPSDSVEEARGLIRDGRVRAAIELLEPVVRQDRENYDAQFYYGQALTMAGEGGLAEWSLRRAMLDPARRREAGLMISANALQANNPREAVKILTEMLDDAPDSVELLLARAEAYTRTRINVDEVLDDVDRVRDLEPDNLDADRAEILAYLLASMSQEAEFALDALGERLEEEERSGAIASWYCTTMALFAEESLEKELARERFEACADEYPADVAVIAAATDFLAGENAVDRAIEILERAIDLYDGEPSSGFEGRLANLYLASGQVEGAEALLIEAAKSENLQAALTYKFRLASFYDAQNRLSEALRAFEEAVALMKARQAPLGTLEFTLADLAIRAGELDRALEIVTEMQHPPFRLMIEARVAQERGDHGHAVALYQEAARLWPDNEFARYHAARSLEQIGDFDGAIELYRHATRISGETTNAMSRIALLLYAGGDPVAALQTLTLQEQRAPLDEIGELLKVELGVLLGQLQQVRRYLSTIPESDSIGFGHRLARVFRGLRLRGDAPQVSDLAEIVDPRAFLTPGGDRALDELLRAAGTDSDRLDRASVTIEAVAEVGPDSPHVQIARALLLERKRATPAALAAAYVAALEQDGGNAIALLGRARSLTEEDPSESVSLARRALDAPNVEPHDVTELARLLRGAGANDESTELLERVIEHTPYEGTAAQALAEVALATGDHSDRALDLATRATRFSLSEETVALLRDTYAARGARTEAEELDRRLRERRARLEAEGDGGTEEPVPE